MVRVDFSNLTPVEDILGYYPWEVMLQQGYHWMDRYGQAYWIEDMSENHLENALRFAQHACRVRANFFWRGAMMMNGEMAMDTMEGMAIRYEEYDVPLVKSLQKALHEKRGEYHNITYWDLTPDNFRYYLESEATVHIVAVSTLGRYMGEEEDGSVDETAEKIDPRDQSRRL